MLELHGILFAIDPSFTIPVLILLIISVTKKNKFFSRLALFWIIFYCILGVIQKERAEKNWNRKCNE